MNRIIKFRGIRVDQSYYGVWKYGNLLNHQSIGEIGADLSSYEYATVIPETVGQFTGLTDKNGKEIYEGDIVCVCNNQNGFFQVVFVNAYVGGWVLKHDDDHDLLSLGARKQDEIEVIGNIHEHPDLI